MKQNDSAFDFSALRETDSKVVRLFLELSVGNSLAFDLSVQEGNSVLKLSDLALIPSIAGHSHRKALDFSSFLIVSSSLVLEFYAEHLILALELLILFDLDSD